MQTHEHHSHSEVDPVCGMTVAPPAKGQSLYKGHNYFFCNPKCKIKFDSEPEKYLTTPTTEKKMEEESTFITYKPLIITFTFVFLISLAVQINLGHWHWHLFMSSIMAGFFIGLSFFKFLDLKSFAEAFSNYDPIAQKFVSYGLIYPFIELLLGLAYIAGVGLLIANISTTLVLSFTTYGVVKMLRSNQKFQCACLGAGFNLPLSKVTVIENLAMIAMAFYGILAPNV